MNQCAIQEHVFVGREDMRRDTVVCPKPRRLGFLSSTITDHPIRPVRWCFSNQAELYESKSGDVLDIILTKGGGVEQSCTQIASSPPFFSGSPPSRVSNPLIRDDRFGDEKVIPSSPLSSSLASSGSPSSSARKGGCARTNFGNKPAVRIEGFDCLNRDRGNCGIPAWA